jgi:hypothetical protein
MRRSDIEVPNLPVDVALHSSCRLDYTFISLEMAAYYERDRFAPLAQHVHPSLASEKSLQGEFI